MALQQGQSQPSRRKSMLPQSTNTKRSPQVLGRETSPAAREQLHLSQSAQESQRTSKDHTMAPPLTLPNRTRTTTRSGSRSTSARVDSTPTSRTVVNHRSRLSDSASLPRPRSVSTTRNLLPSNKRAPHTRSLSHQVTANSPALRSSHPSGTPHNGTSSLRPPKPVFNTYKQHYTPTKRSSRSLAVPRSTKGADTAKGSPLSDPSSSQPASPPEASTAGPISTELIHLHYLHSVATPTLTAWSQSAEAHFHTRFSELCNRSSELHAISAEQQGLLNALALTEWGAGIPSTVIGERVEVLSRDVGELEAMIRAPDGKFERVREVWEIWVQEADSVRKERKQGDRSSVSPAKAAGVGSGFVEGIGDGWKAEAMVLERELGYVKRDLDSFGEVREGSGLGSLVRLATNLCEGLIEELDVMQWIEDEIMREEGVWVEEMVGSLGQGLSNGMAL